MNRIEPTITRPTVQGVPAVHHQMNRLTADPTARSITGPASSLLDTEPKLLKGRVSKLRHSLSVSGANGAVDTTEVAHFEIGDVPIVLSARHVVVDEGDMVRVVGLERNGVFEAVGYENVDKGVFVELPDIRYVRLLGYVFLPFFGFGRKLLAAARKADRMNALLARGR